MRERKQTNVFFLITFQWRSLELRGGSRNMEGKKMTWYDPVQVPGPTRIIWIEVTGAMFLTDHISLISSPFLCDCGDLYGCLSFRMVWKSPLFLHHHSWCSAQRWGNASLWNEVSICYESADLSWLSFSGQVSDGMAVGQSSYLKTLDCFVFFL